MMKKMILILFFSLATLILANDRTYYVSKKDYGIGFGIGNEVYLVGKVLLSKKDAFLGAFSMKNSSKNSDDFTYLHLDYVNYHYGLLSIPEISFYYGFGASYKNTLDNEIGFRMPFGTNYIFKKAPFELFGELSPGIIISPQTKMNFTAILGGRFLF